MRRSNEEQPPEKKKRKRRWFRRLTLVCFTLAIILGVVMLIEASVVRIEYADVQLQDLPSAFDGTTILFVSDIHLDFYNPPARAAATIQKLAQLKPDLILFGGDYTTFGLTLRFKRLTGGKRSALKKHEAKLRDSFFRALSGIYAPLGKFGIPGNHDANVEGLDQSMALGGFELLSNQVRRLKKDGQTLFLAGTKDLWSGDLKLNQLGQRIAGTDCAILLSHNPDTLPLVSNTPGADGAQWADLMLSGHTHGGQVRLFGKSLISVTKYGERYESGWLRESGTELLTSNGMGTYLFPLRLGAPAQVHLITLRALSE